MTVPITRISIRRKASPGRLLLLTALFLAIFLSIGAALDASGVKAFDASIHDAMRSLKGSAADAVARAFDAAGSTVGFAAITLLLAGVFLALRRGWDAVMMAAATVGAWGLNTIAKNLYERQRPELESLFAADGFSYPSGNATIGAALVGFAALAFLSEARTPAAKTSIAIAAVALVLLFGATRIYAGVHYATDIIGGYALGFAYLTVLAFLRRRLQS
ncbi:phosphatase PAP2 family protein [Paenibacillus sp.]|uniref:phosphatase PAP2 family protein n=1 Tax=Paenibacillus sp. TaxID=58172 RepID=UPI00281217DC|nr:phosphatase PAP2 family protein [Paenibacillus sp.]